MRKLHLVNVGENNCGDLLMARAAISALSKRLGKLAVELNGRTIIHSSTIRMQGSVGNRIERRIGSQLAKFSRMRRKKFTAGDLVLDINGYRHGGIWPSVNIQNDIDLAKTVRDNGAHYIMCPKSFGPFNENSALLFRELAQHATRIFARDDFSYNQLINVLGVDCSFCPDYTNGFPAIARKPQKKKLFLYIPNSKIVETGIFKNYAVYASHIIECRNLVQEKGYNFKVLFHQKKDIDKLGDKIGTTGTIQSPDPVKLKYLMSSATIVLSSRYHGMIGALSQDIPCIVIGWTDKYKGYIDHYKFDREYLLSGVETSSILQLISYLSNEENIRILKKSIQEGNTSIRRRVSRMWDEVAELDF